MSTTQKTISKKQNRVSIQMLKAHDMTVMAHTVQLKQPQANILNSYPSGDGVVTFSGAKYGVPSFRLKHRGGGAGIPESDAFWFTKLDDKKVFLNIVLEAFRPENNVRPLNFNKVNLEFTYKNNGSNKSIFLKIGQTPLINTVNILKDIHATAEIPATDVGAVIKALTSSTGADAFLTAKAEIWWQKPASSSSGTSTTSGKKLRKKKFEPNKLRVVGSNLVDNNNRTFLGFKSPQNAQTALRTIQFYKFNELCYIKTLKTFMYFTTNGRLPSSNLRGEDFIPFNYRNLQTKQVGGRWKVVEGNHMIYDFEKDGAAANEALNILKSHKASGTGYVKRPKPGMVYLKTNAARVVRQPGRQQPVVAKPMMMYFDPKWINFADQAQEHVKPKKVEHSFTINLSFEKNDPSVFGELIGSFIHEEYKWIHRNFVRPGEPKGYDIYYRPSAQLDTFFFLPQVFRIKANNDLAEPQISIAMQTDNADDWTKYRIHLTVQILPYFHPKAKKDLFDELSQQTNGAIQYVNLSFSGYSKARFELNQAYAGANSTLRGKINESLESINSSSGFNLSIECNMENFDFFKRELIKGIHIGDIIFELEQETTEGPQIIQSKPIAVELNLNKLANIDLPIAVIQKEEGEENEAEVPTAPYGCAISNRHEKDVEVGGVALTLISKMGDVIYDIDLDLRSTLPDGPFDLVSGQTKALPLLADDIDSLDDPDRMWTDLIAEPYSVRFKTDPEAFINRIIDYASGDPEEWTLEADCVPFSNLDSLSEEQKTVYGQIIEVAVQIKKLSGTVVDFKLSRSQPTVDITMTRTLSELLNAQDFDNKVYQYRQLNYYLTKAGEWSEWKDIGETEVSHLKIYPIIDKDKTGGL
jgi:hypothetical protein